jgi:hypothetical protein
MIYGQRFGDIADPRVSISNSKEKVIVVNP